LVRPWSEVLGPALLAVALTASSAAAGQRTAAPGGASCDRTCLLQIADSYLAALVAHAPSKAPLAPNVKFTEQAQVLKIGEGLWKTITEGPTAFRIPVADPIAGQVAVIVMLKANPPAGAAGVQIAPGPAPAEPTGAIPVQLALRLKVQNRQITEAEHLVARITNAGQLANLQTVRPALLASVPPAQRTPREFMLLIGNAYYDALEQSDGEVAPFADDCGRRENGMHTAGVGAPAPQPGARGAGPGGLTVQSCAAQLNSRSMSYINSIDLRRVWIADEEKGLVFGLTMFRHPMQEKFVTILNPDGTTRRQEWNFNPFDLAAAHIFKIYDNRIHEIEAMGFGLPLYSKNGWSQFTR
jgi:hypothetical protein